jgi:hypothetical protein
MPVPKRKCPDATMRIGTAKRVTEIATVTR